MRRNFPTFSAGTYAQDQRMRGKVLDYRIPIEFGGVTVHPGDIVFGDRDGVLVVPSELEEEVFSAAIEKGMSSEDTFEKYGIM